MAATKTKARSASTKTRVKTAAPRKAATATTPAKPASTVGQIAHTEFASADPAATKAWAQKALGWKFLPAMPMQGGDYHMWETAEDSGGIRSNMPPETPGTVVYVEVADIKSAYAKAIKNGAKPMMPPEAIGGGMGRMAIVSAPGGVAIGLWAQR